MHGILALDQVLVFEVYVINMDFFLNVRMHSCKLFHEHLKNFIVDMTGGNSRWHSDHKQDAFFY